MEIIFVEVKAEINTPQRMSEYKWNYCYMVITFVKCQVSREEWEVIRGRYEVVKY